MGGITTALQKGADRNDSMTLCKAWKTSVNTAGRKLKPVACINVRRVASALSIQVHTHGEEEEVDEEGRRRCRL